MEKYELRDLSEDVLRGILRMDALSADDDWDSESFDFIYAVMRELARRREERGEAIDPKEALERFKKRFPHALEVDEDSENG